MTILPMLAIPSTGASGRPPIRLEDVIAKGWILDTKMDGVRAFVLGGRLINREGVDITHRYPEITTSFWLWVDGEIVAEDGTFETTLLRDQQSTPHRIKKLAEQHPCRFVAFDLLATEKVNLVDERTPYSYRRKMLEDITRLDQPYPLTPIGTGREFFDQVAALGMEGVIAKRPDSRYEFGRRSPSWVKFKNLHRVTCVAVGYLPGQGQRAHFGSMKLALIDGDTAVPVGRVGSGFSEREINDVKARLDAGQFFPVEIECTNRTSSDQLRFPVFKGVRTDRQITDCTIDQLDALPTC